MNWNALTRNPKVILGYYENVPSLQHVELHRFSLLRDGPCAELVFDLAEYPQNPSPSWPAGANTCQVTLGAWGLSEIVLNRWDTGLSGDLEITQVQNGVAVSFSGEGQFRLVCMGIDVSLVSGYIQVLA